MFTKEMMIGLAVAAVVILIVVYFMTRESYQNMIHKHSDHPILLKYTDRMHNWRGYTPIDNFLHNTLKVRMGVHEPSYPADRFEYKF